MLIARMILLGVGLAGFGAARASDVTGKPMVDVIADDFAFAARQYSGLLARVKGDPGIPKSFRNGVVVTTEAREWTSGFFGGALWLIHEFTHDEQWAAAARDYTTRLESIRHFSGHHDVGFMLGCSYGQGLRLKGDSAYRDVLLDGADALATRFNPKVGAILSWNSDPGHYRVIVDNLMNLELLLWAARVGDRPRLREIALSHADKTLANHFRADGSSWHVVDYDPETGAVQAKQTAQGNANDSAWARGQAWGLYGFTMLFRETRQPEYLAQAVKIADFLRNHPRLPADGIPYWDYDAPRIPNAPRDASAAAIMASALIELSGFAGPDASAAYLSLAEKQLRTLSSPAYRAPVGENGNFLLMHGVGHFPAWSEVDTPLVYADYYFLEALLRFRAKLVPAKTG
jgi:unsaturated chondroitin disaccharide hydrolase